MKLSNEWKLIIAISIAITFFSQLPLLFGYLGETQYQKFMGIPVHITDANNHLHWMLQAKEGEIFFTNKFTHEDVPALIFNPYHLLIGNLSRFSGLDILVWYHLFNILLIFGFLLYLYRFITEFISDKRTRLYAFLFAGLGSGFGFIWYQSKQLFNKWIVSADLWVTDMNIFGSFGHPHFTLATLLMLAVFLHGYRAIEKTSRKDAIYSGLYGLLLGFVHIFDVVTVAVVLAGWYAYRSIQEKKYDLPTFFNLSIIGILISPSVLYYLWILLFNPTYAEWNALNQTVTPNLPALLSGFGLLIIFAVIQIYKERKKLSLFSVWMILNLILVYLPINVQRRFLLGIGIPLAILSAQAYIVILKPYLISKKVFLVARAIIIALVFGTTLHNVIYDIATLHEGEVDEYSNTKYLSRAEYEALEWIENNIQDEAVIIAPLRIGNHIPANTNNRVYLGHWAQTIRFEEKQRNIKEYYAQESDDVEGDLVWNQPSPSPSAIAYANEEVALTYR